ncbi:branched-chain amino acid ABC transporter permease [Ostreibacterium oceani]|uniref:Branched-chain amino acid ABC transporter permease n=1 Tax=Ostreibacterium oceani TaxID=2654998 RepID=A0A6N7EWD1_9GAMM|nr:branched-chain amino acid ABC transporter permease [Ostreibacterium oceani]MPV85895.1 branched-chain amino acid ABC transporter permease [Ostreibacterium oceani]
MIRWRQDNQGKLISLALWLLLLLLPIGMSGYSLSQFSIYFCYGIFAMSLAFLWGQVGLLCLGQAIFFGVGAYSMSLATLGMLPTLSTLSMLTGNHELMVTTAGGEMTRQWLGIGLAVLLPMFIALCMAWLLFNGNTLDGAFLGLVTLALAVIAERLFGQWSFVGGSNGLFNIPPLLWQGNWLSETSVYFVTLGVAFVIWVGLVGLQKSPLGLIVRAVRDNEHRSSHLGIHTVKVKTLSLVLSAGIAGLAGALFVTQFYFVSPDLVGFRLSTEVLIWVAVAGRLSCSAAFFGAISVRLLEGYLGDVFGDYWLLLLGLLFILVVMYLPKGLLGKWLD